MSSEHVDGCHKGKTRIEDFLLESEVDYDAVDDGIWVLHDDAEKVDNIVVMYEPPVVVFRVKLMELPADAAVAAKLNRRLLELNATEMIAGAYGIEGEAIVATETLQAENLDYNEFQAAIEGLTLAITEHYEDLKSFHQLSEGA